MDGYGIATFDVSEAIFLGSPTTVLFRRLVTSAQWLLVTRPLNPLVWIGSRVEADCMVEEKAFFFFKNEKSLSMSFSSFLPYDSLYCI